jgi:hypothetical protein
LSLKDDAGKSTSNRLTVAAGSSTKVIVDGGSGSYAAEAVGLGANPKPTVTDTAITIGAAAAGGSTYFVKVTDQKDKTKSLTVIVSVPK